MPLGHASLSLKTIVLFKVFYCCFVACNFWYYKIRESFLYETSKLGMKSTRDRESRNSLKLSTLSIFSLLIRLMKHMKLCAHTYEFCTGLKNSSLPNASGKK